MIEHLINQRPGFEPAELAMLKRVLDEVLRRRSIAKDTKAASNIAADIISLFEHGIRNEQQLLAMLSGTRNVP